MPIFIDKPTFSSFYRNLSWNFIGQIIGKSSLLLFHIFFANLIGARSYGEFSFIFVGGLIILQPILDLGLNQIITKWVSRGNIEVVRLSFSIKGIISCILIPIVLLTGWWFEINFFLLLTITGFFFFNTLQQSLFGILRGIEDLRPESVISAIQNLLALGVLYICIFLEFSELWIGSLILMISRLSGTMVLFGVIWKTYFQKLRNKNIDSLVLNKSIILRESLSLGLVILLIQFYFRVDTIMLGILASKEEVGFYNIAYNLMEGTFFIPTIVMASIFPGLSKNEYFLSYFRKGVYLLTLSGIFCGMSIFLLSDFIINYFFAPEFLNSARLLKILSCAIPLVFWGYLTTQSLIALDLSKFFLLVTAFGLAVNVTLNFFLIPENGASGAAIATVITEAFIPLICYLIILKYQPSTYSDHAS